MLLLCWVNDFYCQKEKEKKNKKEKGKGRENHWSLNKYCVKNNFGVP